MLAELALAMSLHSACLVSPQRAHVLAEEIIRIEVQHGLPEALLAAVVLHESGGRNVIQRNRHGCDVGVSQIHVRGCKRDRVRELLDVRKNLETGAKILLSSRVKCSKNASWSACKRSRWGLYNSLSKGWARSVKVIWHDLRAALGSRPRVA